MQGKKKRYSPPAVTERTPEQARQFVVDRTNCTDQEAVGLLQSLRKQQQREPDNKRERSA